jgi:hypothetical protein
MPFFSFAQSKLILSFGALLIAQLTFGQPGRDEEYKKIQAEAAKGFVLKSREQQLTGGVLKAQLTHRATQFHDTALDLAGWIDKYYPVGDKAISTDYVKVEFIYALYTEYSCNFVLASKLYHYVEMLLFKLSQQEMPEPEYNGVKVSSWVNEKLPSILSIREKTENTTFSFDIQKSARTGWDRSLDIALMWVDAIEFRDVISSGRDEIFAFRMHAKSYADSVAGLDLPLWSSIYFDKIFTKIHLPFRRDSCSEYQLWTVGRNAHLRAAMLTKLNKISKDLRRLRSPDSALKPVAVIVNCLPSGSMSSREFISLLDDELHGDTSGLVFFDHAGKWNLSIQLLGTSPLSANDSLLDELMVMTVTGWVCSDFDKPPRVWMMGLPNRYYQYSKGGPAQTADLYVLQTAMQIGKLPAIEDFIKSPNAYFEYTRYNLGNAYSRYFFLFLDARDWLTPFYRWLEEIREVPDSPIILQKLESISNHSMTALNRLFIEYIKEINLSTIPKSEQGLQSAVIKHTKDRLGQF